MRGRDPLAALYAAIEAAIAVVGDAEMDNAAPATGGDLATDHIRSAVRLMAALPIELRFEVVGYLRLKVGSL